VVSTAQILSFFAVIVLFQVQTMLAGEELVKLIDSQSVGGSEIRG
jgi:hypothetical protein